MKRPPSTLPVPIRSVWSAIESGASIESLSAECHRRGWFSSDGPVIRAQEHRLHLDFADRIQEVADRLALLAPLELSIAPSVVAHRRDPAGRYGALLTRYAACPGEALLPVVEGGTIRPFRAAAVARFQADLIRLYRAGYDHSWALRGWSYQRRGSRTGALVLEGWESLIPLDACDLQGRLDALEAKMPVFTQRLAT